MEENASAPPGERLSEADMLIDPGYEEMLERQGKELCEEVGRGRCNVMVLVCHLSCNTVSRLKRADLLFLCSAVRGRPSGSHVSQCTLKGQAAHH